MLNSNETPGRVLRLFCALAVIACMGACSGGPATAPDHSTLRLIDLFKRADKSVSDDTLTLDKVLSSGTAVVTGIERSVIRQHPSGTLRYRLRIPRNAVLRFGYCMAPYTWRKSPDGVRFHLRARRVTTDGGRAAQPIRLWSAALDPMNNPAHRRVFEQQVDLDRLGGGVWELAFTLSHGAGKNVEWDNALWIDPRIEFPDGRIELPARDPERPDILLVTIDSLRADVLDSSGNGRVTAAAPVIAGLAADGFRASTALTPTTLPLPSYASILTGSTPTEHGQRDDRRRGRPLAMPTAGERFSDDGYRTAAFLGNARLAGRNSGLSQGFESFDCPVAGRRSAEETVLGLLDWIRQGDEQPWFCWLQLDELNPPLAHLRARHRLYYPRGGFNRWDESIIRLLPHFERRPDLKERWYRWLHDVTTVEYVEASYLGQTDDADRQLGRVIDELRNRSQLDHTVIVITSNRGLALGEQGVFYTGETLQPGVTRVPLIIRWPGKIPAGTNLPPDAPCSTTDILPTLLALVPGGDTEEYSPPSGFDLMAALRDTTPIRRRELLVEGYVGRPLSPNRYALLAGGYKLVASPGLQGIAPGTDGIRAWTADAHYHGTEFYDLTADPQEQNNLSGSRPLADVQHHMQQRLARLLTEQNPLNATSSKD